MTANKAGSEHRVRDVIHDPEAVEGEGSSNFHVFFLGQLQVVILRSIMNISPFCHRNPC